MRKSLPQPLQKRKYDEKGMNEGRRRKAETEMADRNRPYWIVSGDIRWESSRPPRRKGGGSENWHIRHPFLLQNTPNWCRKMARIASGQMKRTRK